MEFDPEHRRFGEFISQRRKQRGLSQAKLAEKIGKSTGAVSQFETAHRPPPKETCDAIAAALGLPPERLWLHAAWGRLEPDEREALLAYMRDKPARSRGLPMRDLSMALTSLEGGEAWSGLTVHLTALVRRLSEVQFFAGVARGPFDQSRPVMLGAEIAEALRLAVDLPDAVLAELISAIAGMARSAAAFKSSWPVPPHSTFFATRKK